MQTNQSSTTAENNAAIRAYESMRPAGERVCHDPYARYFISDTLHQASDLRAALEAQLAVWETLFPGVCDAIVARTRFIDDCLSDAIRDGLQQLVILGAGYDTRALRFECYKKGIAVFELDHPATQAEKLNRCRQRLQIIPEGVAFVPVDFNTAPPGPALCKAGFDRALNSLFICEGMTYYLAPDAVQQTLSSIATVASDRSGLVFDYVAPAVINGTSPLAEARVLSAALKQRGEAFLFGLDPDQNEAFLHQRGFELLKNQTAKQSNRFYFDIANVNRAMSEMFFFALARLNHGSLDG